MTRLCPADPSFERLQRLMRGELSGAEAALGSRHAAACEICSAEQRALLADRALLGELVAEVPTEAGSHAHAIVERAAGRPSVPRGPWIAVLAAGTAALVVFMVLRGGPPDERAPRRAHRRAVATAPAAADPAAPPLDAEVVVASGVSTPDVVDGRPLDVPGPAELVVRLGDGSLVSLHGPARATLRAERGGIAVLLDRGQVECRVTPRGPGRAFVVRAPGVEARVHGTRFIVRAPEAAVIVLEGRVEVLRPQQPRELLDPTPAPPELRPSRWLDADGPCAPSTVGPTGVLAIEGEGLVRVDGRPAGAAPLWVRCAVGAHRIERVLDGRTQTHRAQVEDGSIVQWARLAPVVVAQTPPDGPSPIEAPAPTEDAAVAGPTQPPAAAAAVPDALGEARRLLAERRYGEARVALERWMTGRPDDLSALFLLGEAQRLGGDRSSARATFEQVASRGSGLVAANALNSLALLAERQGPTEALAAWDRYLAAYPGGSVAAEATLRRANALVALGRQAEARAALRGFLDRHPNHPRRAEVERRLDETP